jgi:hypothetical protein
MYAAPGVIGYTNDGRLTLNGSKEYKGTLVDPAVTPRTDGITTLENETVYVAYFKWGSLIATSSQPARADGAFSDGDIIAAPTTDDGYKGLAQLKIDVSGMTPGTTAWGGILYRTGTPTSGDLGWSLDMASGLGDPCDYYFGDRDGDAYNTPSDWRVPAGGSGTSGGWYKARTEGAPFGTSAINQTNWKLTTGSGNGAMWIDNANDPYKQFPIKGAVAGKSGAQDWSMFLPAAGYRNDSNGQVSSQGTNGCYWSSTAYSSTLGYGLGFSSSRVNPSGNDDRSSGFSVRCVRP